MDQDLIGRLSNNPFQNINEHLDQRDYTMRRRIIPAFHYLEAFVHLFQVIW